MMLLRDTLERKDFSIIGGKSCKKFLQNHALEACCFFAHVKLKSNQQLESAVEISSHAPNNLFYTFRILVRLAKTSFVICYKDLKMIRHNL